MKLKKLIAALSAVTMLGSMAVVPAMADAILKGTPEAHTFIIGEDQYALDADHALKFDVKDRNQVYYQDVTFSANSDTRYSLTMYGEVGTAPTQGDVNNTGLYTRIRDTSINNGKNQINFKKSTGTKMHTTNGIVPNSDKITLRIYNRDFGDGSINYAGWSDPVITGYRVTAGDGYTIVSGVDSNGFADVNGTVFYKTDDSDIVYSISISAPTAINDSTEGSAYLAYNDTKQLYYNTLQDAANNASTNDTITLLADANGLKSDDIKASSITFNGNGKTISGTVHVKNGKTFTINNATIDKVQLETGTKDLNNETRNTIVLNNSTVNKQITTDLYRSERKDDDLNRCGIVLKGNCVLNNGIGLTSYANSLGHAIDTLDVTEYTGSPISVTVMSSRNFSAGINFFTGSADKVTLDETTAATYELSNGALVKKSTEPDDPKTYNTDYFKFTFTDDDFGTGDSITFNKAAISGTQGDDAFTGSAALGTTITVSKNTGVSLFVNITDVPTDVTITSLTLE